MVYPVIYLLRFLHIESADVGIGKLKHFESAFCIETGALLVGLCSCCGAKECEGYNQQYLFHMNIWINK